MASIIELFEDTKTNFKTSRCTHHILSGEFRGVYDLFFLYLALAVLKLFHYLLILPNDRGSTARTQKPN